MGVWRRRCLKYIHTLCELGILYKETPFGEKETSRKTIYGISDLMFRFWYRYVLANRSLLEMGASDIVWRQKIEPDYSNYMGLVFEQVCRDYMMRQNINGKLPFLFTDIGRGWGTDSKSRRATEIDLIASDGRQYLIGECKWRNELVDASVLKSLRERANAFYRNRGNTWYVLFSKSGFTEGVKAEAAKDGNVVLIWIDDILMA